jgi:hypothetical protein
MKNIYEHLRKYIRIFFVIMGFLLLIVLGIIFKAYHDKPPLSSGNSPVQTNNNAPIQTAPPSSLNETTPQNISQTSNFGAPLERANERINKKPFGIFITPQNSPVQLERFQGYHTGTDLEIFPDELNQDVSVKAVCSGKIRSKSWVSGYGGVLIQDCSYNSQPITIIYGHLNLASIVKNAGNGFDIGEKIGILGNNKSQQTDGERKHLQLGIHKGNSISFLGYVQNKSQLSDWINACDLNSICN